MKLGFGVALASAIALAGNVAMADDVDACAAKMAPGTKLIAVGGDAVATFAPDNDPNSLEVVFMTAPGESRVTDDGQVIYVSSSATSDEQQALSLKALQTRARIKLQSGSC